MLMSKIILKYFQNFRKKFILFTDRSKKFNLWYFIIYKYRVSLSKIHEKVIAFKYNNI